MSLQTDVEQGICFLIRFDLHMRYREDSRRSRCLICSMWQRKSRKRGMLQRTPDRQVTVDHSFATCSCCHAVKIQLQCTGVDVVMVRPTSKPSVVIMRVGMSKMSGLVCSLQCSVHACSADRLSIAASLLQALPKTHVNVLQYCHSSHSRGTCFANGQPGLTSMHYIAAHSHVSWGGPDADRHACSVYLKLCVLPSEPGTTA